MNFKELWKENAPEVKTLTGVMLTFGAMIWGCYRATKLTKKIEEAKKTLDEIEDFHNNPLDHSPDVVAAYSKKDYHADQRRVYLGFARDCTKLMAGPVLLKMLGDAFIFSAASDYRETITNVSNKLTAALIGWGAYRSKIRDILTDDQKAQEAAIANNIENKEIDISVKDPVTGAISTQRRFVKTINGDRFLMPPGSFLFSDCKSYTHLDYPYEFDQNHLLLAQTQSYFAYKLIKPSEGYIFLNEILKELGYKYFDPAGQALGIINDTEGLATVDLGIQDVYVETYDDTGRLVWRPDILIDIKLDGDIRDRVAKLINGRREIINAAVA